MALVSILLSVVALICTAVGFLTTPIPVLGAVLSFGAAGIAVGGVMLAGRAETRAKQTGQPRDTARIAQVLNVIALVPALLVALTCGVCNALFSTGSVNLQKDFRFGLGPTFGAAPDAGPNALPPPPKAPEPEPEPEPGQPTPPAEPSKLPPPPLPAGPRK